ncbi:hypothetical protein KVV02_007012 [Mortierella alpina]|uniref:HTH CENPB-type domain-containing protein n=1 Tax=Mortierella alpina TaxID=64518 RepID=A0A9P8A5M3_MORAP|nr:hypothetical protein KVV02_007012 [Mortierella alpina]
MSGSDLQQWSATGPRRRTAYSYADKAKFLDAYHEELRRNPYVTLAPIAKLHGVHLSTAMSMVKDEPSIRQALKVLSPQATKSISRKRKRHMAPVETSLLNWFKRERTAESMLTSGVIGFKVTDGRLRGTALLIWRDLRKNILPEDQPIKFKFSNGWLSRFKNRHGLKKYTTHGESESVDMEACKPRTEEIQGILADFDPEDIYNCDVTGLFLKTTSNTSIDLGPALGRKIIRDARVSILFCSNATGSDKRRPFILCVEIKADQVKQLQEELKQKYGDDCDLVAGQNDFTVLHYLDMIDSEGPSLSISESICEVLESEEYQDLFIAREDRGTVDEELLDDAEEDEDEEQELEEARDSSQDCDYEPPSSDNFNFAQEDSIALRSREVERLPDDGFASPHSSLFREEILDDEPFRYNMDRFAEARASIMSSNNKELAARYAAIALSIDTFLDDVNLESGEGEYEGVDGDYRNVFR